MKKILTTILISLFVQLALAQSEPDDAAQLAITASVDQGDILLRWAPTNPTMWYYANEYGYTLERYTYRKNGKIIDAPTRVVLSEQSKPAPLNQWEQLVNEDDFAAVAAQCLFGEDLQVLDGSVDMITIANKAKELESRFSLALLSADQNLQVAQLSGLYFRDVTAKDNEQYLYRVYANIPTNIEEPDTAAVYYGISEFKGLPKPRMLRLDEQDKEVRVMWNTATYDHIYNYYLVQRSTDGESYTTLNGLPVVTTESGPSKQSSVGGYVDTTATVGTYYYRVIGRNAFNQKGPASDSLAIKILPESRLPLPQIINGENVDNQSIQIDWNIPFETEMIKRVFLERAQSADGPYTIIKEFPHSKRSLLDERPNFVNYYRVTVEGKYQRKSSFPYMIQLIDSIPPPVTQIVHATVIDSLVTITWNANPAEDLMGYRIYKANYHNEEPSLVNKELIRDTVFQEVVKLKTLSKNLFYYVAAIDHVENQSEISKGRKLKKPDIVPPTEPVIKNVSINKGFPHVMWQVSSSSDVKSYLIYRKRSEKYQLAGIAKYNDSTLTDRVELFEKEQVIYRVVAVDSSGNEGVSTPFLFKNLTNKISDQVRYRIYKDGDELAVVWDTVLEGKQKVNIYLKNEERLNLIEIVDFSDGEFRLTKPGISEDDLKVIFR